MCGISGILDSNNPVDISTLTSMCETISHRGPDDSGIFLSNQSSPSVGLGSRRLSIIDLSSAGHMPMEDKTREVTIVYNGEIYNHLELRKELERRGYCYHSRTDTETLLYAYEEYGLDCFKLLNGIFAVAIYDARKKQLILARDRMGIKPLYYYWDGSRLIFASELKAVLAHPEISRQIDYAALELYLTLGYVPSPYTMFAGVRKLEPGHLLSWQNSELSNIPFWSPGLFLSPSDCRDENTLVKEIHGAVSGAVCSQLMSDVPVGVMLSGGLDSTIVATLAKKNHSATLHTFSVGFQTNRSVMESVYNHDRDHAKTVAKALGTSHHEVTIRDDASLIDDLEKTLFALDEPVWEPSYLSIYAMSTLARQQGVKVLLSGDGSDELFGGYPWYQGAIRLASYERIPFLRPFLNLAEQFPAGSSLSYKARDLKAKYRQPGYKKYLANYEHLPCQTRQALLARQSGSKASVLPGYIYNLLKPVEQLSTADQFAFADLSLWVRDHFNQRIDRMTMLASVEGRVPFQDNSVVDLALSIGMNRKIKRGHQKALLVEAFKNELPESVLNRSKRPFAAPAKAWLQGSLNQYALEQLSASSINEIGLLNGQAVEAFSHSHLKNGLEAKGALPPTIPVWNLLALTIWARQWKVRA